MLPKVTPADLEERQTGSYLDGMEKFTRRWLFFAIAVIVVQWIVFRIFYPYASYYFTDSFGYIHAAVYNQDVNVWPVGYSKFLRVFNTFFHSDGALVTFQYLFLQFAGLYFLLTLLYLFRPGKAIRITLWLFFIFQPLSLYVANSVASDALFIGGSLVWVTQLLRMIHRPSRKGMVIQALLTLVVFTIRYNAMYYPLVAALGIGLSGYPIKEKALAIVLPFLFLFLFLFYTRQQMEEITGAKQFSPFSGWQIANNALYTYGHVSAEERVAPPARFAVLDSMVRHFYSREKYRLTLFDSLYPGIYFLWSPNSPLTQYMGQEQRKDTGTVWFRSWASVGPLYADYGAWLIRQYPGTFAQHYLWPNLTRYALPPLEFMDRYNSGMDTVDAIAKYWFHYKDNHVRAFSGKFQHHLLAWYPLLNLLVNLFFLGVTGLFFTTRGIGAAVPSFRKYVVVITALWAANFLFSIVASPVVLRYQLFLLLVSLSFSLLLVECLLKWEHTMTKDKTSKDEEQNKHTGGKLRLRLGGLMGVRGY